MGGETVCTIFDIEREAEIIKNYDTIFVVGETFNSFASDKQALTVSQLEALLQLPASIVLGKKRLLLGQGVSEDACNAIFERLNARPDFNSRFDTSDLLRLKERAPQAMSHKHKAANTLVSKPNQIGNDEFQLDLLIDEMSELMGDHQTGQHIQGMVLIEALRQSFLVVTDTFYPLAAQSSSYFVINSMEFSFQNFVFPLPAQIYYRSIEFEVNERRSRHAVEMKILQDNQVCTTSSVRFTVYPRHVVEEKEADLASKTMASLIKKTVLQNGNAGLVDILEIADT